MDKYTVDQLPLTTSGKRMLRFVAPIYENSFWLKSYFDALGVDFDVLAKYFSELRAQSHISSTTWGIEYLERKYSVEPAPHLSLTERRARLRAKAAVHLPLNPAVLEKFASDNYDFDCYLDETHAGFIRIIANHIPQKGVTDFIPWLAEEKPAHLALEGRLLRTLYVGDERYAQDFGDIHEVTEAILPIDDNDKKHFPRLFADVVNCHVGYKQIMPEINPHDTKAKVFIGGGAAEFGIKKMSLAEPFAFQNNRHLYHAAQALTKGGALFIEADLSDLPLYQNIIESPFVELAMADIALARDGRIKIPVEVYERFQRIETFVMALQNLNGSKVYSLHQPEDIFNKHYAAQAFFEGGLKTVKPEGSHFISELAELHLGHIFARTGLIKLGSETKSTVADNELFFVERGEIHHAEVVGRHGIVAVDVDPIFKASEMERLHFGNAMLRAGSVQLGSETKPDLTDNDLLFAEILRLCYATPMIGIGLKIIQSVGEKATSSYLITNHVGQIFEGRGKKTIHPDNKFKFAELGRLHYGNAVLRSGSIQLGSATEPDLSDNDLLYAEKFNLHYGEVFARNGLVDLATTLKLKDAHAANYKIGQAFARTGAIKIGSETKPDFLSNDLNYVERMDLRHGQALAKTGITVMCLVPPQRLKVPHIMTIRVGQSFVRRGGIIIGFGDDGNSAGATD